MTTPAGPRKRPRCQDCGNQVWATGLVARGVDGEGIRLCGPCLTTPPDVRRRQVHGCISADLILGQWEQEQREAEVAARRAQIRILIREQSA